jgi:hypothetical protein
MTGAFFKLRITDQTAYIAERVHAAGELVELKDRKGEVHVGWVRQISYEVGLDQGWFVWFQYRDDTTTRDVIANILGHNATANGAGAKKEKKAQTNRAARRRRAKQITHDIDG